MAFVCYNQFGDTCVPPIDIDYEKVELNPNFSPTMDLNFPADYQLKDQKEMLHIVANYFSRHHLMKPYCPGDV